MVLSLAAPIHPTSLHSVLSCIFLCKIHFFCTNKDSCGQQLLLFQLHCSTDSLLVNSHQEHAGEHHKESVWQSSSLEVVVLQMVTLQEPQFAESRHFAEILRLIPAVHQMTFQAIFRKFICNRKHFPE